MLVNLVRVFAFDDLLKDVKGAENDLVILPEYICTFHLEPPLARVARRSPKAALLAFLLDSK